ncbi:MAG: hypothetical protein GX025_03680 [Clostridiales bacterium]|nr:hypothetical protein [Clostridiales bacterium]
MDNIEDMINGVLSNPEQMKKVMELAGTFLGGENSNPQENQEPAEEAGISAGASLDGLMSGLSNLPEGLASAAGKLLGGSNKSSRDKTQLLEAMKPWLSEKRRGKLDMAMKAAKVMRVAGSVFISKGG